VRAHAVWRDTAGAAALAALDPGIPDDLDREPDVLVVGGGLVGLATAALCARAGLGQVVLLERDTLAAGASGGAAALLTPEVHVWTDPLPFVDLARTSLDLTRTLDREWAGALGLEPVEWLIVLPKAIAPGSDLGVGGEALDAEAARTVEPELGDVAGALLIHEQARVHPLRVAAALAARAGTVATGVNVRGVEALGERVTNVHTSHGDFHPGSVVFATGLAPRFLAIPLPQHPAKGHLLATAAAPFRLRVSIAALDGLIVQLPGGEIVAGGTLEEGDHDPAPDPAVIDAIHGALSALVPRAAELDVVHGWCCFRPATADHQPVIDRVPGIDNAWLTCGHFRTGILMAAATGDALARWIRDDARPDEVATFGVARLAGTAG
jgi:glycine oxidase